MLRRPEIGTREHVLLGYIALHGSHGGRRVMYAERRFEVEVPQVPELEDWQRVLLLAADIVEYFGWCQHLSCTGDGRVCMGQAIQDAVKILGMGRAQRMIAYERIGLRIGYRESSACVAGIILWNDVAGRTRTEVIAVLRECARA